MAAPHVSHSTDDTLNIARALGRKLSGGTTVLLYGDLGTGKTVFARGLAEGLGVADPGDVTSPTFTIVHEYGGRLRIFHVDLYRLDSPDDIDDLALDELVAPDTVVIVEWADKLPGPITDADIRVRLIDAGGSDRRIEVEELAGETREERYRRPEPAG